VALQQQAEQISPGRVEVFFQLGVGPGGHQGPGHDQSEEHERLAWRDVMELQPNEDGTTTSYMSDRGSLLATAQALGGKCSRPSARSAASLD
jgi:hypothetical protein